MASDQDMKKQRMCNLLYAAICAGVFVLGAAILAPHCRQKKPDIRCIDGHSYKMHSQYGHASPILLLDSLDRPVHCKE